MRGLGESSYYTKLLEEPIKEILGDKKYIFTKDPIDGVVLHTDRVDDETLNQLDEVLDNEKFSNIRLGQYNHHIEISWRDINKYVECVTVDDMLAVNPDYKNDLTSDGEWVHPLPELVQAGGHTKSLFTNATNLRKVKLNLAKATSIGWLCHIEGSSLLEEINIEAPAVNGSNYTACAHVIQGQACPQKMRFVLPKQRFLGQFFWGKVPETPQHLELYAPKMEEAWNGFTNSSLNKPSVMGIFNQLQTFTSGDHPLGIGIHVDHKTDDEILEAIANAEAKGWTLTVRWNGKPTAQSSVTYGLRKPPIYAKVAEYERPDGTTERVLEWGHYVTNPEDYQEFSSLEEAYEHFGISNDSEELNNSEQ